MSDTIPTFTPGSDPRLFYPGQLLSVAAAAVPGHLGHGDSDVLGAGNGEYRMDADGLAAIRLSADLNGLRVWNKADCFITRVP